MAKYNKYSVKTKEVKKTWHYFVATNKTITQRFRVTKEMNKLINNKIESLGTNKSQYITDLILIDCGYKQNKGKNLIYGVDWEL